jgi:hypothetical protein
MAAQVENMRMPQLPAITAAEIVGTDIMPYEDLSALTTKKIEVDVLRDYITGYVYSGSVGLIPSSSVAISSSFSTVSALAYSAVSSSISDTSLSSVSASYAATASYALNVGSSVVSLTTSSLYPVTASWAITSSYSVRASQSLFLAYNGSNNGTSSYSMASLASDTASYVALGTTMQMTASHATNADNSQTASFLSYAGVDNGTSSYSINSQLTEAATYASRLSAGDLRGYMIYGPYTGSWGVNQSYSGSFTTGSWEICKSTDAGLPVADKHAQIMVSCMGLATSSWTGSNFSNERFITLKLHCYDDSSEIELDSTFLDLQMGGLPAPDLSGSYKTGFRLEGWADISGSYKAYITASRGIDVDYKPVKFKVETNARNFRWNRP